MSAIDETGSFAMHQPDVRLRAIETGAAYGVGPGSMQELVRGFDLIFPDRKIEDLDDRQFAAVFDTKVHGLRWLLEALSRAEAQAALEGDDDARAENEALAARVAALESKSGT